MSMGLGKRYFVHVIKYFYGSLEECLKYMNENKPANKRQWYELRPDVHIRKYSQTYCENYQCSLVEEAK